MAMEKFSSQARMDLLKKIRALANKEGTQLQVLIHEAFEDLLEKRKQSKPREQVLAHFQDSLNQYDALYKKLAQ